MTKTNVCDFYPSKNCSTFLPLLMRVMQQGVGFRASSIHYSNSTDVCHTTLIAWILTAYPPYSSLWSPCLTLYLKKIKHTHTKKTHAGMVALDTSQGCNVRVSFHI